jgi:hypothetical protein
MKRKQILKKKKKQELQNEESLWVKSKSDNTISSYQYYLEKTKLGKYNAEANRLINENKKNVELKRRERYIVENEQRKTKEKDRGTSRTNNDNIRWK